MKSSAWAVITSPLKSVGAAPVVDDGAVLAQVVVEDGLVVGQRSVPLRPARRDLRRVLKAVAVDVLADEAGVVAGALQPDRKRVGGRAARSPRSCSIPWFSAYWPVTNVDREGQQKEKLTKLLAKVVPGRRSATGTWGMTRIASAVWSSVITTSTLGRRRAGLRAGESETPREGTREHEQGDEKPPENGIRAPRSL